MKLLMMLGGLLGFVIGLVLGLAQGSAWSGVFWRASVGALAIGIVMRWWGRVWLASWVAARRERAKAAAKSEPHPVTGPAPI